jgi:hypothetical protein
MQQVASPTASEAIGTSSAPVSTSPASRASWRNRAAAARSRCGRSGSRARTSSGRQCRRGVGRGQAEAEVGAWGEVPQVFDQSGVAGDIATTARQRLAERTHMDVNGGRRQPRLLAEAPAGGAQHAERMRLVHHEQQVVPLLALQRPPEV